MTSQISDTNTRPRRPLRSTAALLLGFLAILILSLGTDQLLHTLRVYPPWGEPMRAPGLYLLALTYRSVYGVIGSYIAAKFAPHSPMRHALALGFMGLALSGVGAIIAIAMLDAGSTWYPVALAILALPCAWFGGVLHRMRQERKISISPSPDI